MSHFQNIRMPVLVAAIAALLVAFTPAPAAAQRRVAVARGAVHYPVYRPVYRGPAHYYPYRYGYPYHYAYPYYWRSAWWFSFGFSYPWGYPYGYASFGYPYFGYPYAYPYPGYVYPADLTTSVRVQIPQRDAEVFVDGYSAGKVDDFDGVFQRLHLRPGGHEIAIYLDGHRTFRQELYVSAGSSQTIRHELERLGPGEIMEPRPSPDNARSGAPGADQAGAYDRRTPNGPIVERVPREEGRTRFGTLSIRVQPAGAEILVDGERWSAPADSSRIAIELAQGRHTVEVRKDGVSVYREDVLIRPGTTTSLNVSLAQ